MVDQRIVLVYSWISKVHASKVGSHFFIVEEWVAEIDLTVKWPLIKVSTVQNQSRKLIYLKRDLETVAVKSG